jgi:hypothetical protein
MRNVINKFLLTKKINNIQKKFLKAFVMTKIGMVWTAYRRIESLPERRSNALSNISNKFEKGLSSFVFSTLKKSFKAFKILLDEGQSLKKYAIFHFSNGAQAKKK